MYKYIVSIAVLSLISAQNTYGFLHKLASRSTFRTVAAAQPKQPKRPFWSLIKKDTATPAVADESNQNKQENKAPTFSGKLAQQTGVVTLGLLKDLEAAKKMGLSPVMEIILDKNVTRICGCWETYYKLSRNISLKGFHTNSLFLEKNCKSLERDLGNYTVESAAQQINSCPSCLKKVLELGEEINYAAEKNKDIKKK